MTLETTVLFAAMAILGAAVFYAGYWVGTRSKADRQVTKILDRELAPPRLHSAEDAAEQTQTIAVVGDDDLIAPDDSWPRQRLAAARESSGPGGGDR